jgi:hypothetical protein
VGTEVEVTLLRRYSSRCLWNTELRSSFGERNLIEQLAHLELQII